MTTKFICLAALLLGCFLPSAEAQPFTTLYPFTGGNDGCCPAGSLILAGNTLYGTTSSNFDAGTNGTIFSMDEDGSGFTNLYSFTNGGDGAVPLAGLVLSGGTVYGTASQGGKSGYGTIFSLNTNGNVFKTLYAFTNGGDGGVPLDGLVLSGNTLYGACSQGGALGKGTVFSVTTSGMNFNPIYSFTGQSDGASPHASLVLAGNTLYGTALGDANSGVVFSLNTNGGSFLPLHQFSGTDGADPIGGLILSGGTLYGTTSAGGSAGYGTVFSISSGGTGFQSLYNFTNRADGGSPLGTLVLSGDTLYGTASTGANSDDYFDYFFPGFGTVFSLSTTGSNFTSIYAFTGGSDGYQPEAGLMLEGNTLFGTAFFGGEDPPAGSVFALSTSAHRLTTLLSFNGTPNSGANGAAPEAPLILAGSEFYGTAFVGGGGPGDTANGSVFSLNTNGSGGIDGIGTNNFGEYGFTFPLYDSAGVQTNSDGAYPQAGVILSGATLYGTTTIGGTGGYGTIFSLNTNYFSTEAGFETLYDFTNGIDGGTPLGGLVLSGNTLYGTCSTGGAAGQGAVFSLTTDGKTFKTLYAFTNTGDGSTPEAGLFLSGNTLYGTTYYGGPANSGTIFSINTDGLDFTTLYAFTNASDGAALDSSLILSGNTLYGTASTGGVYEGYDGRAGTVFSLNLDTVPPVLKTLYTFIGDTNGAMPKAGLILSDSVLYGTTVGFGVTAGTIFAINTNGTDFTTLYIFAGGTDGGGPQAGLLLSGNTLYGTAASGGFDIYGTVFALNLGTFRNFTAPIGLNIAVAGKNVILTWNDPAAVFSLQAAPGVEGVFTNVPGATSPFTNAITSSPKFFRLVAPN